MGGGSRAWLRQGEALGLKWEHVDLDADVLDSEPVVDSPMDPQLKTRTETTER